MAHHPFSGYSIPELMIYGDATVEIVEYRDRLFGARIVEENAHGCKGLVWAEVRIMSFSPEKCGYAYSIKGRAGGGWLPEGNVRNFRRLDAGVQ